MTFYLTSVYTFSLSGTVFEIFDFKVLRVWPWPLEVIRDQKYSGYLKTHTWLPIYSLLTLSFYIVPFLDIRSEIFWGLTLTFRGHLGSKIYSTFESPYMISYLTSIDTGSLSGTVFEIFDFKILVFDLDLWPQKVTQGRQYFHHSKAHTWCPI